MWKCLIYKLYDMKKIYPILLILFVLYGCVEVSKKKFSNEQQESFDNMLALNRDKSYHLGNKILEKEFDDSVKLAIGKYMDSVRLFVNWTARITNINSEKAGNNSVALTFELEYKPEEYREVTFDVVYVLPEDSLCSDKVYNTIKNLENYSTVYFDGFIRKKANGEAYYNNSFSSIHSYPDFNFFVVDINTTSKGDTLSGNLQKAVDLSFEEIEPLELNFKNEISKKELDKRLEKITPQFTAAKEVLTQEERAYIDRLLLALTYNFYYAQ